MLKINFTITKEEIQKYSQRKLSKVETQKILTSVENDLILWDEIEKSIKEAILEVAKI